MMKKLKVRENDLENKSIITLKYGVKSIDVEVSLELRLSELESLLPEIMLDCGLGEPNKKVSLRLQGKALDSDRTFRELSLWDGTILTIS